jgi:hypothetical protein
VKHEEDHGDHGLLLISPNFSIALGSAGVAPLLAVDFVDGDRVLVLGMMTGFGY